MNRADIENQLNRLELEVPEYEQMGEHEIATRVKGEIRLFKIALNQTDDEIRKCQLALPGRASILRMAQKKEEE